MIGHLYRYPHPNDSTRFIYVGQGAKRDKLHRQGVGSFGRRFRKLFPDIELPQPVREDVEVQNQLELNELETVWMFHYHTWHGYQGGMNIGLPGSSDYSMTGKMGGIIGGRKRFELHGSPQTTEGSRKGGLTQGPITGQKSTENKTGIHSPNFDKVAAGCLGGPIGGSKKSPAKTAASRRNGAFGRHVRWHVHRSMISSTCSFCQQS